MGMHSIAFNSIQNLYSRVSKPNQQKSAGLCLGTQIVAACTEVSLMLNRQN